MPRRTGTSESRDSADRSGWLSHALSGVAVAALGLAVAGSISVTNASSLDAGSVRDALGADVTKAEPADKVDSEDDSTGSTKETGGVDGRGDLDTFDRRQHSTSRDVVRKQLDRAIIIQKSKQRDADLDDSNKRVQENNRNVADAERSKELQEAEQKAAAEAKRRKEERERKLAEAKRAAETQKQAEQQGLPTPPGGHDFSDIPTDGSGVFPLPPGSYRVGARFGEYGSWARYHTGQDLGAAHGTPIRAALSGKILPANAGGWAGNHVVIRHADGGATLYAHMSATSVQPGQSVKAGQVIGYVGSTGRSFGAHLHLEYYPAGTTPGDVYRAADAMAYLRAKGVNA